MPADLTAEAIFHTPDTSELKRLYVPQWKGYVYIRLITAGERDEFEAQSFRDREQDKPRNVRARFAVLVCCDAAGQPLFARDLDPQVLRQKSGAALDLIFEVGSKFNGMGSNIVEDAEAAEQAALKNSEPTPVVD